MIYNVLHTYEADVETTQNPYDFQQQQLFEMALRINKKRQFLFVSQVLGKHLAVEPAIPLLTSHLLAYQFMQKRFALHDPFALEIKKAIQSKKQTNEVHKLSKQKQLIPPKPLTIIGFAETATALGHGFFEKFGGDVQFVHTTRELLADEKPIISFEEEHSHASSHRVYGKRAVFEEEREIVLVDDEMTTGKTNRNIIRQLHQAFPNLKTFTLVSILDFRSEQEIEKMQQLQEELAIEIDSVSLFNGSFVVQQLDERSAAEETTNEIRETSYDILSFEAALEPSLTQQISLCEREGAYEGAFLKESGRFGLTVVQQTELEGRLTAIVQELKAWRHGGPCLVLGTGEFMYIPMLLATKLGDDVFYHATTRSPIYAHEQTCIKNKFTFQSAEFPGVTNYLYNIPANKYEDIFIIYERIMDEAAVELLYAQLQKYAKHIHIVTLGGVGNRIHT